jgi:hypothetical protein
MSVISGKTPLSKSVIKSGKTGKSNIMRSGFDLTGEEFFITDISTLSEKLTFHGMWKRSF